MDEDRQLLSEVVDNNSQEAFARLVGRHVNMVYATALRALGDAHLADDVTQAVFLLLWRNSQRIKPNVILGGWLFRVTCNVSAQVMRSRRRRIKHELGAAKSEIADEPPSDLDWQQVSRALNDAVIRLKKPNRDAIVLRFFEGRQYEEIGKAMGISPEAAKMRVSRAVKLLRETLSREGVGIAMPALAAGLGIHPSPLAPAGVIEAAANPASVGAPAKAIADAAKSHRKRRLILAATACLVIFGISGGTLIRTHGAPAKSPSVLVAPIIAPAPTLNAAGLPVGGFVFQAAIDPALADRIRAAANDLSRSAPFMTIDRVQLAKLLTQSPANQVRALSAMPERLAFPQASTDAETVAVATNSGLDLVLGGQKMTLTNTVNGTMKISAVHGTGWKADIEIACQSGATTGQSQNTTPSIASSFSTESSYDRTLILLIGTQGAYSSGHAQEQTCPLLVIQLGGPPPVGGVRAWLEGQR